MQTPNPYSLLAELTYRCPLKCPYCSNPLELHRYTNELDGALEDVRAATEMARRVGNRWAEMYAINIVGEFDLERSRRRFPMPSPGSPRPRPTS